MDYLLNAISIALLGLWYYQMQHKYYTAAMITLLLAILPPATVLIMAAQK